MIIAYVSKENNRQYDELQSEFMDVNNFSDIEEFINYYAISKNKDVVLLYKVESIEDINALKEIYFIDNIYMILIGKDSSEFSLLSGKLGVDSYIHSEKANLQEISRVISESQSIIKKRRGNSNVTVFTGITGGVGTTTIAMNLAHSLAEKNLNKNVLFLDFASTKAVSNLFFDCIQPTKTIIDILNVQQFEMEELFNNGVEKISNNFYFVPGIQKHTDKEDLNKPENIQIFLNFIMYVKEKFDFIIIDVGVFEDIDLEIDIQEIADNIFVITEFSIPSMSILKTYIDIIDKSGWYKKTHIVANRADSFGNITHAEATKILSKGLQHNFEIDFSLPNDAMHLRECWNEAELVSEVYPSSPFMESIYNVVDKFFIKDTSLHTKQVKDTSQVTLLQKIKSWL